MSAGIHQTSNGSSKASTACGLYLYLDSKVGSAIYWAKYCCANILINLGSGGDRVVSVLAFYCEETSSNTDEVLILEAVLKELN